MKRPMDAMNFRLMDEVGAEGGGAQPTETPLGNAPTATEPTSAPTDNGGEKPAENTTAAPSATDNPGDLSKVTLGDGGKGENANPTAEPEKKPEEAAPEVPLEDYADKVSIDESIAKDVMVDKGAMMAVAPLLKEAGVSVEMAGKLLNTLAKYQVEQFKERQQERYADNKKMHDAAVAKYSRADFEQINAGIDAAFKPDGVMNFVVRNSELGNDPEFLELMKWYGQHRPTDTQPSTAAATGGTTGQGAGYSGIAGAWS